MATGEPTRFDPRPLDEAVAMMVRGQEDGEGREEFTQMFQCVGLVLSRARSKRWS